MAMHRFQLMIDDELDDALERQALKEGVSKAEISRRLLRRGLNPLPSIEQDALWSMVGVDDDPADDGEDVDIDAVVYGS